MPLTPFFVFGAVSSLCFVDWRSTFQTSSSWRADQSEPSSSPSRAPVSMADRIRGASPLLCLGPAQRQVPGLHPRIREGEAEQAAQGSQQRGVPAGERGSATSSRLPRRQVGEQRAGRDPSRRAQAPRTRREQPSQPDRPLPTLSYRAAFATDYETARAFLPAKANRTMSRSNPKSAGSEDANGEARDVSIFLGDARPTL